MARRWTSAPSATVSVSGPSIRALRTVSSKNSIGASTRVAFKAELIANIVIATPPFVTDAFKDRLGVLERRQSCLLVTGNRFNDAERELRERDAGLVPEGAEDR